MPDAIDSAPPNMLIDGYTLWKCRGITADRFRRACHDGELVSVRQGYSHNSKLLATAEAIRAWLAGMPSGATHISRPKAKKEPV